MEMKMSELINAGISLLTSGPQTQTPPLYPVGNSDAVNAKVIELRRRGFSVRPAEGPIPGLWEVSGHPELTTNQLLSL